MEEANLRILRPSERGAALVLALLALTVLLPVALVLSTLVLLRQRQVRAFREEMEGRLAVRSGLVLTLARLRSDSIALREGEQEVFESTEVGPRAIDLRVIRQADVVLTQKGEVVPLPPGMKGAAEVGSQQAQDPGARTVVAAPGKSPFRVATKDVLAPGAQLTEIVPLYRRLAVYVVEVKTRPIPRIADVRLLAAVVRTHDGRFVCVGQRTDRGHF